MRHDADYFLTVEVTNHARLTTTLTHQFTVDVTPPLEGVVFEGPVGSTNVDYQQELEVVIWWTGFFDRETDVLFYQLSVGTECRNDSHFTYPATGQVGGAAGGGVCSLGQVGGATRGRVCSLGQVGGAAGGGCAHWVR